MYKNLILPSLALCALLLGACATDNSEQLAARQQLQNKNIPFASGPFISAVKKGDVELVRLFLQAGVNLDEETGVTPMVVAARNGHEKVVMELLDNGAEIDQMTYYGTPLIAAACKGKTKVAQLLIERDADIDLMDEYGSALMRAANNGHLQTVQLLVANYADVNEKSPTENYTALHLAAKKGSDNICAALLDNDADINLRDNYGRTALDYAAQHGHAKTVKLLLEREAELNPDRDEEQAPYAVRQAVFQNYESILKSLIASGASVNSKFGSMPLLVWAAKNNYLKGAKLLLQLGADKSLADATGMTALDYALQNDNKAMLELLRPSKKK